MNYACVSPPLRPPPPAIDVLCRPARRRLRCARPHAPPAPVFHRLRALLRTPPPHVSALRAATFARRPPYVPLPLLLPPSRVVNQLPPLLRRLRRRTLNSPQIQRWLPLAHVSTAPPAREEEEEASTAAGGGGARWHDDRGRRRSLAAWRPREEEDTSVVVVGGGKGDRLRGGRGRRRPTGIRVETDGGGAWQRDGRGRRRTPAGRWSGEEEETDGDRRRGGRGRRRRPARTVVKTDRGGGDT
ncbi:hypothetical protein PR202_gb03969 [Eleusine coracana subsp. coracana]|uniref:Uncharacterized protein n=1 Tax=Eleusine coracana subsp. coracana TaxID=191504 RepID=A0AAV5E2T5_ELECO|nr:hypothetical protein PR202_gb03969 [Eleusine coracana subsp. coracana]